MTGHKQVRVKHPHHGYIEVDELIAPLLKAIWKLGIETTNSCQENRPGVAWIEFLTTYDTKQFLDSVAKYSHEIESLYNRITGEWDNDSGVSSTFWEYSIHPWDFNCIQTLVNENELDEEHTGNPDFEFSVSIRFPVYDIKPLTKQLKEVAASKQSPNRR